MEARAHQQVADYAKRLYPWAQFDTDEDAVKTALRQEAPAMIAEWYRYYEPENLPAYLERLRKRAEENA